MVGIFLSLHSVASWLSRYRVSSVYPVGSLTQVQHDDYGDKTEERFGLEGSTVSLTALSGASDVTRRRIPFPSTPVSMHRSVSGRSRKRSDRPSGIQDFQNKNSG